MTIVTLKDYQLTIPKEIRNKCHLRNGQKLAIETTTNNVIRIKPIKNYSNDADAKLLELLNNPVHMGKIKYKCRKDIYDDIN